NEATYLPRGPPPTAHGRPREEDAVRSLATSASVPYRRADLKRFRWLLPIFQMMPHPWRLAAGFLSVLLLVAPLHAQDAALPMLAVPLDDLSAFQPAVANWQVAGGVEVDRDASLRLDARPGTGILVNLPRDDARDNLFTGWTHGDIELELEFLVPKGSN